MLENLSFFLIEPERNSEWSIFQSPIFMPATCPRVKSLESSGNNHQEERVASKAFRHIRPIPKVALE